jgi:Ca2+/H+ antiporter
MRLIIVLILLIGLTLLLSQLKLKKMERNKKDARHNKSNCGWLESASYIIGKYED